MHGRSATTTSSEDDGEGLVADQLLGHEHGVTQAQLFLLANIRDLRHISDLAHAAQHLDVALALEQLLEFKGMVEVILDRPLLAAGHDDDLLDAGFDGLFYAVLNNRPVDQRQHLLWLRLRCRQEPCAPAGGRENCFSNPQNDPRELCVGCGGSPANGPGEAPAV